MFILKIDEGIQGYRKEFSNMGDLRNEILNELDGSTIEVLIIKNAASTSDTALGEKS